MTAMVRELNMDELAFVGGAGCVTTHVGNETNTTCDSGGSSGSSTGFTSGIGTALGGLFSLSSAGRFPSPASTTNSTPPSAEDLQEAGNIMMATGAVLTAADGPLPFGDAIGVPLAGIGGATYLVGKTLE